MAAIVALPLCLALGVASGLGPAAGLYGAIACGILAAIFGGTKAQCSGPTGTYDSSCRQHHRLADHRRHRTVQHLGSVARHNSGQDYEKCQLFCPDCAR